MTGAQRDARTAHITALKIDAIESEMTSEFVNASFRPRPVRLPETEAPRHARAASVNHALACSDPAKKTLPDFGATTRFLLEGLTTIGDVALPLADGSAVIEEAAILFADNQLDPVEQMLRVAIQEDAPGATMRDAWWMLFDLYQISGRRQEFDNLSIAYAARFETSPPAWHPIEQEQVQAQPTAIPPGVSLSGKLDHSSVKQLERIKTVAEGHQMLRLEFGRVTEVDPIGCGLLLGVLKELQNSGRDVVLGGAARLADMIRNIIEVGRRGDSEAPSLLLLDILQRLNDEKAFEEAGIDYCVTFEVSPPPFVARHAAGVTAAQSGYDGQAQAFAMPSVIDGSVEQLILAIARHADDHNPALIDCARLRRVGFSAAGKLIAGLAPFCTSAHRIEFHNVNHLVGALLDMMGPREQMHILRRRY